LKQLSAAKRHFLAVTFAAAFYSAIPAHAGTIVDQSPPNGNGLDMTDYRVAHDFTLAGSYVLDAISFWYFAQDQSDLSNVTYGIYQNSSGALGALLYTGTLTPATSFDNVNDAFFATITLPDDTLNAGTYWLELHGGTSFTDDNGTLEVDWANVADNANLDALINTSGGLPNTPVTTSGFEQLSFLLDGTAVPEPSAALLAAPALAGLLGFSAVSARLRKRRAHLAAAIRVTLGNRL
jgi:hypothetical protein